MNYFAVERLQGDAGPEPFRPVVELVFHEAHQLGLRCKWIELQGDMILWNRPFVRFRSDLDPVAPLIRALESRGRGVVEPIGNGYQVRLRGETRVADSTRMHLAPLPGMVRRFRGTAHPLWQQQFPR